MSASLRRWLACVLASALAAFALVFSSTLGCGGISSHLMESGSDSGTGDRRVQTRDAPAADAPANDEAPPSDSPGDATPLDCGTPTEGGPGVPVGAIRLMNTAAAGFASVAILGVTEDDRYVLYYAYSSCATPEAAESTGLFATPLDGGQTVGVDSGIGSALLSDNTVFAWVEDDASIGTLGIGTSSAGVLPPTHIANSAVGLAAASSDSTKIAFTANVHPGVSGDLYGGRSDFDGGAMLLLHDIAPNRMTDLAFVNNRYLIAVHADATESGTAPFILTSWDTTTSPWGQQDLLSAVLIPDSAFVWSTATTGPNAGTIIVAATTARALYAIPVGGLDGGGATFIDNGVTSFYVKPDGSAVLYGTLAGAYKMAALPSSGVPTDILPEHGGYAGFANGPPIALSPDGNWSIFNTAVGKLPSEYSLDLVQNVTSATPTPLVSTATGGIFHDAFTANSTYALYYTGLAALGTVGAIGQLNARPVTGGAGVTVSDAGGYQCTYLTGPTGTKIVYDDHATIGPRGRPIADISTVDVAAALPPTSIIKSADANYFLTTDRKTLVFGLNTGNTTTNGIYAYTP